VNKPLSVVRCPGGRHRLSWLEVGDDGELVAVAQAVAPGRERLTRGPLRIPKADLEEYDGYKVMVGCACGHRWFLDLCDVLRGASPTLQRLTGDDFPGVSFDR